MAIKLIKSLLDLLKYVFSSTEKRYDKLLNKYQELDGDKEKITAEVLRSLKSTRYAWNSTIATILSIIVASFIIFGIIDSSNIINRLAESGNIYHFNIRTGENDSVKVFWEDNFIGTTNNLRNNEQLELSGEVIERVWTPKTRDSLLIFDDIQLTHNYYKVVPIPDSTRRPYVIGDSYDIGSSDLAFKIKDVDSDTTLAGKVEEKYTISFYEKGQAEDFQKTIYNTVNGKVSSDPIRLWKPTWNNFYNVRIGIGSSIDYTSREIGIYKINLFVDVFKLE